MGMFRSQLTEAGEWPVTSPNHSIMRPDRRVFAFRLPHPRPPLRNRASACCHTQMTRRPTKKMITWLITGMGDQNVTGTTDQCSSQDQLAPQSVFQSKQPVRPEAVDESGESPIKVV